MTPLSRTPGQVLRVATRLGGAFVAADIAPTVSAVLVNGQARLLSVDRVQLTDGDIFSPSVLPGQYAFVFDGSNLRVGDIVTILFRAGAGNRQVDGCVSGRVCAAAGYGVPSLIPGPPVILPPGGDGALFNTDTTAAYVANSFAQQFQIPEVVAHYVAARLGSVGTLGPPPHLGTTISSGNDGYYPAQTLGGMALYPTLDQREPGNTGSTDAIDAMASQPLGTYDFAILTSGFIQEQTGVGGIAAETVPGSGADTVVLEVKRRVISEIASRLGGQTQVVVRMTHEGYRTNNDVGLAQVESWIRRQVLGARQLEAEGLAVVLAIHYVWSRLQYGAFGPVGTALTDPVPAYVGLTHSTSTQPGNRNYGWLNRTQGVTAPFAWNTHQNAIAAVVEAWAAGYALWDINPIGDTTFQSPVGLLGRLANFISPDGMSIYAGHATGVGLYPWDPAYNPGGPPDSELVLDWSPPTQEQIQRRIVDAVDDLNNGTTEFEP